jgi:hypothetical protein
MKPILLFQCGSTQSTPWADVSQTWNSDSQNNGYWITPVDAQSYLFQFTKQNSNFLFTQSSENDQDFCLVKPFVNQDSNFGRKVTKVIDTKFIIDWMEKNTEKSLGFGAFLNDNSQSQVDILNDSVYYSRSPWMGGHVYNVQTGEFISSNNKPIVKTVTFFYVYRLKDYPVYFFIFNPSVVSFGDKVEFENDLFRCRVMDTHMGSFSTQFMTPKMSKNAYPLEEKWYVVHGDEFTFEPGGLGIFKIGYGIDLDKIKVSSDLEIEKLEGNKYKARFKDGQQSAYISLRLNTGNTFDWTFINSGNRLVYNIRINRHYKGN